MSNILLLFCYSINLRNIFAFEFIWYDNNVWTKIFGVISLLSNTIIFIDKMYLFSLNFLLKKIDFIYFIVIWYCMSSFPISNWPSFAVIGFFFVLLSVKNQWTGKLVINRKVYLWKTESLYSYINLLYLIKFGIYWILFFWILLLVKICMSHILKQIIFEYSLILPAIFTEVILQFLDAQFSTIENYWNSFIL